MASDKTKAYRPSILRLCNHAIRQNTYAASTGRIGVATSFFGQFNKKFSRVVFAVASSLCLLSLSQAHAGERNGPFIVAKSSISAPAGFSGLCSRYRWACAPNAHSQLNDRELLRLATAVNNKVNRQTSEIDDRQQYGREEHWALPTARGGDCEDFALLKKKTLVENGASSTNLLIATVLDRNLQSHAVLVVRTSRGDVVLDNLNRNILPWNETGYTFLKLQNPASLGNWHAVMAGGLIRDRPTASR